MQGPRGLPTDPPGQLQAGRLPREVIPEEGSKRLRVSAPWSACGTGQSRCPPASPMPSPRGPVPPFRAPSAGGGQVYPHPTPRPAQDERDDAQLHVAGGAVELPQELAPMVHGEEEEEEEDGNAGAFAFLSKLRDADLPALRDRALGTVGEVKEKCALM